MNISFLGGGNMARAIIGGLKINGFDMKAITVIELDTEKRVQLSSDFAVKTSDDLKDVSNTNIIVLAVKPQQLQVICKRLKPILDKQLIISIAAGIRSADISRWLGNYTSIVRVMPNTPAQIQAGISALYGAPSLSQEQHDQASTILAAVGDILWLDDESKMDAVTAISGSGPAYVFYFIEALQEAAVDLGLTQEEARNLALQTFSGASLLAAQSVENVKNLRSQVTSKGGTTEQGILVLETANIKEAVMRATKAAAAKSVMLGNDLGTSLD